MAIVALLTGGAIGSWPAVLQMAILTAFCHAISTGARLDEWDREHGHAHAMPHASVRAALESLPPHEAHEVASIERRYGPSLRFLQA